MNNYAGSIDTDMAIGTILSNFETPWIMNTVQESLNMRFRPFDVEGMPNFPDILQRQFNDLIIAGPDYAEKTNNVRLATYKEIITAICEYYNFTFTEPFETLSPDELYGICRIMYDIFISRFTIHMEDFFIEYIIRNMDSIYAYLMEDETVKKPREKDMMAKAYIDPKLQIIHANVNKVIMNMAAYDIPLNTMLEFFAPNEYQRLAECIVDNGDAFKNYYAIYLLDDRYYAQLLTDIKLKLQYKTQISFSVADMGDK